MLARSAASMKNPKQMTYRTLLISLVVLSCTFVCSALDSSSTQLPALVRFVRIYGGTSEILPPVLLVNIRSGEFQPVYGERRLTLELDVQTAVPPSYRVSAVHCRADWTEDNNVFLNDVGFMRSSQFNWQPAPASSRHYSYRATMAIPNETLRIPYGGNWKLRVTDYDNDTLVLAEARFFALDCATQCSLDISSDFYEPTKNASPSALSLECSINATMLISDLPLHTAVFYRMNRWNEPLVATTSSSLRFPSNPRFSLSGTMAGIAGAGKRFRVRPIPAECDYRVLDLINLGLFPRSSVPIRLPISDLRRRGYAFQPGDDAAMTSYGLSSYDDDYVPIEFVLDPENRPSDEDVFVVGSFNNWKASAEWQMVYNSEERLYRLRHWVRRARHNYYYGTGRINADTKEVEGLSFEEFEGNNAGAGMSFVCFVYYREPAYGGYDNIVGVSAASIYGPRRR